MVEMIAIHHPPGSEEGELVKNPHWKLDFCCTFSSRNREEFWGRNSTVALSTLVKVDVT